MKVYESTIVLCTHQFLNNFLQKYIYRNEVKVINNLLSHDWNKNKS